MTRNERRQALRREAEAWRKIGRRIERDPREFMWVYMTEKMMARAEVHFGSSGSYVTTDGVARAIGAYWLALECEDEAKR